MSDEIYHADGSMENCLDTINNHMADADQHINSTERNNFLSPEWSNIQGVPDVIVKDENGDITVHSVIGDVTGNAGTASKLSGLSFRAFLNVEVSYGENSTTKIPFANESWDSDSKYDTVNTRFLPGIAGYYFIFVHVQFKDLQTDDRFGGIVSIRKNGNIVSQSRYKTDVEGTTIGQKDVYLGFGFSDVISLTETDYLEIFMWVDSGHSSEIAAGESISYWGGFRIL